MTMRSARQSGAGLLVFLAKVWPFWRQKRLTSLRFLAFMSPNFFGGLNQTSANKIIAKFSYLVILKISCKNIEKWRRSMKKFAPCCNESRHVRQEKIYSPFSQNRELKYWQYWGFLEVFIA